MIFNKNSGADMLSRRLATNGTPRGTREGDPLTQARFRAQTGIAYLTGIQAIARLPLDQRRLDDRADLDTAGFISGYRGSPLGSLDRELWRLSGDLGSHRIVFQPGINEDLAATAVWGSQQVGLFAGARHEGVYGMWYGKAPGLDRSSDAVRHANAAGTSPRGGVLLVVGDDHACKSSTLPSASEFAMRDLGVPILAPADVQVSMACGVASAKPTFSRMLKALSAMARTPSAERGWNCPPVWPGRTGLTASAKGAARSALRARLPPDRRARAALRCA